MIAAETYWSIVTNPPHIFAELTWSIILDIILIQPVRLLIRRHDRTVHATDHRRLRRRELKRELHDIT